MIIILTTSYNTPSFKLLSMYGLEPTFHPDFQLGQQAPVNLVS